MIFSTKDIYAELENNLKLLMSYISTRSSVGNVDSKFWYSLIRYYPMLLHGEDNATYDEFLASFSPTTKIPSSIANEIINNVRAIAVLKPSEAFPVDWCPLAEEIGKRIASRPSKASVDTDSKEITGEIPETKLITKTVISPDSSITFNAYRQSYNAYPRAAIDASFIEETSAFINDLKALMASPIFSTKTRTTNQNSELLKFMAKSYANFFTRNAGYAWAPLCGGGIFPGYENYIVANVSRRSSLTVSNDSNALVVSMAYSDTMDFGDIFFSHAQVSMFVDTDVLVMALYLCPNTVFSNKKELAFAHRPTSPFSTRNVLWDRGPSMMASYAGALHFCETFADMKNMLQVHPRDIVGDGENFVAHDIVKFYKAESDGVNVYVVPKVFGGITNVLTTVLGGLSDKPVYGGVVPRPFQLKGLVDNDGEPLGGIKTLSAQDEYFFYNAIKCGKWRVLGAALDGTTSSTSFLNMYDCYSYGPIYDDERDPFYIDEDYTGVIDMGTQGYAGKVPCLVMACRLEDLVDDLSNYVCTFADSYKDKILVKHFLPQNISFRKVWHAYGPWLQ